MYTCVPQLLPAYTAPSPHVIFLDTAVSGTFLCLYLYRFLYIPFPHRVINTCLSWLPLTHVAPAVQSTCPCNRQRLGARVIMAPMAIGAESPPDSLHTPLKLQMDLRPQARPTGHRPTVSPQPQPRSLKLEKACMARRPFLLSSLHPWVAEQPSAVSQPVHYRFALQSQPRS